MFGYLILLFTVLPALELAVLIHVGTYIGTANTLLIIILTGVVGASLARLEGFLVIRKIQSSLEQGVMPTEEMLDGLMIFCGGILLLTPGFITDTIGFLLLVPMTRLFIKILIRKKIQTVLYREGFGHYGAPKSSGQRHFPGDFEDADFTE